MSDRPSIRAIAALAFASAAVWVLGVLALIWLAPHALDYAAWAVAVLAESVQ
jgi:membrane protein YdbS with pleckstrin-like domain